MPKDNENIPLPFVGPLTPSEPPGFAAEQMIRCEECLRANPPTRVSCLYCTAPLPLNESSARLRRPTLRPPEKHQLGYSSILLPQDHDVSAEVITEAGSLLKLSEENLQRIILAKTPLPLARTASREETELVSDRLRDLGLRTLTLGDDDLGLVETSLKRVRSMSIDHARLTIQRTVAKESIDVRWPDVVLIVAGRLLVKRVEIKERKTRKAENEILDASEFFDDEAIVDFYASTHSQTFRVSAKGFDFSCLESKKTPIANENIAKLLRLIVARATNARLDDSYHHLRQILEPVWGSDQETQSSGWRRERPGKLSLGVATINSNESQFTRYSRLRYYFTLNPRH